MRPIGLVSRAAKSADPSTWTIHVGPIGVFDGKADYDVNCKDLDEAGAADAFRRRGGWLGFTDKYWLTALIPDSGSDRRRASARSPSGGYQADYALRPATVAPGPDASRPRPRFFAGAKEKALARPLRGRRHPQVRQGDRLGLVRLVQAADLLAARLAVPHGRQFRRRDHLLTLIVRALMFPIAQRQFASMAAMRTVQPKMKALQERYKDDKPRQQQEMMTLYKAEKVNPLAGCLPILLQIPIFYALYKVLMLTIEMRHQPFVLWIKDLSAPDPLTPVNLFGLLPFTPPHFLAIGVLPILLGITMCCQFKLNPPPMDPTQKQVFAIMPWVLMFVMAPFAAGLQLYWITTNLLTHRAAAVALPQVRPAPVATRTRSTHDATPRTTSSTERARKLFAGPVAFLKSAPALEFLPDPDVPEVAFAGRSNVGKSSLLNALTNRNGAGAHLEHAGADAGAQLLRRRRAAALRLVDMPGYGFAKAPKDMVRQLALPGERLPARPRRAEARAGADRLPPRHQGRRSRDHGDARQGGGQLPPRPDQGRQDQGDRTRRDSTKRPRPKRASTPPRIPTSSRRRAKRASASPNCAPRSSKLRDRTLGRQRTLLKLIIGNKAYSSWSLRGWLAVQAVGPGVRGRSSCRCSTRNGTSAARATSSRRRSARCRSCGTATCVVWDSLAIIEFLADQVGRALYWPEDDGARAMARSMAAEMHSSFANLRRELPMNVRKSFPPKALSDDGPRGDRPHPGALGAGARALRRHRRLPVRRLRRGGHHVRAGRHPLRHLRRAGARFAGAYMKAVLSHPHVAEWIDKAQDEPWVIEQYEVGKAA